ncbi:hypothetical protein [Sphingobacterium paludis]|uniref:Uncharacterized protein n=1 Tax=Sphingobacterium paludis TaxID=1476465 RepID=A0A4R7DC93_9SPHI|nr:hypothetical protein [Sphingobacterium paludis]TDS17544.1 hypothetical protein B0I21_101411 [Sphingobacterium paludis]
MFIRNSKSILLFTCLLSFAITSCRKGGDATLEKVNSDTQLMFTIAEQTGEPSNTMIKLKGSNSSSNSAKDIQELSQEENKEYHFIDGGAFRVTTSIVREPAALSPNEPLETNKLDARMSGPQKASSRSLLARNIKYRVVLYDRSTSPSTFVSTTLGTAGSPLYINVEKGKNYDWAVFSFNDENDPGDMQDVVNTGSRDLLHARGTTGTIPGVSGDKQLYTVPIHVRLQHKLANVSVQVTAKNYPARITGISGVLGRNNYFFRNKLDIKSGNFADQHTQIAMGSAMAFKTASGDTDRVADYYTSSLTAISDFFIQLNTLSLRTPSNDIRTLSSPVQYRWNNISPVAGQRTIAKINIQPVQDISGDRFKILSIGEATYGFYNQRNSGIWLALHSGKNFGPQGTYPTTNLNWDVTYRTPSLTAFDDILTGNYKMVFVSYAVVIHRPQIADLINTYVDRGGTIIWFTQIPTHPNDRLVWERFTGSQASGTPYSGYGGTFNQNPLLNGPFGDARGTTYGEDALLGAGISNVSSNAEVLAVHGTNPNNILAWKAKDKDFYYFADGGFQRYIPVAGPGFGDHPFLLTAAPDYVPRIGPWYKQENVSNSVVFMNIIAKTIDKVMGRQ